MRIQDDRLRLSPSDLSNHLACVHLTALGLAAARGQLTKPTLQSQFLEVLKARGLEHEKAYVESLRAGGLTITDLSGERLTEEGFERTRDAIASGADVIVQAPLGNAGWAGYADVLLRVEQPSDLGNWSYEVVDTKLARETRGGTILQLWVYSDIVAAIQGRRPERFHVVTPGEPFIHEEYRLDDFAAYYRLVKARLESAVTGARDTYPEPTPHCDICRWSARCSAQRRADDHLSLVAGIRRLQIDELYRHDVRTLTTLAGLSVPIPFPLQRGSRESMVRLREQARVQLLGRTTGRPEHELLALEPERGLHRLPDPSPGDIFLDLEGDPFAGTGGLEYLFGWVTRADDGMWRYEERWAIGAEDEKTAFQAFIAFAIDRLTRYPDLHIYHYAPYEPSALKRLMGRFGVCGDELDRLLRGGTLVDLYAIVRQSLRASVERYSIKSLEPFYVFVRETPLPEASQALRQVEYLLETNQPLPEGDPLRAKVASYNRDDCVSAAALRDWLESLRSGLIAAGTDVPRPPAIDPTPTEDTSERDARVAALAARLASDVPAAPKDRTREQQARWLLAQLLDFHRREDKAAWWDFFRVADLTDEDRLEEPSALAGLTFMGVVPGKGKLPTHRYAFPPQECDFREDARVYVTADQPLGTVAAIDKTAGSVDIKKTKKTVDTHPTSIFANQVVSGASLGRSLERFGNWVADNAIDANGPHRAERDLLLGLPPRGVSDTVLIPRDGLTDLGRAIQAALELRAGVLPIQGPPGSGKTYTGARVICALVGAGLKVGVTAVSHKVITKLLEEVVRAADASLSIKCIRKVSGEPELTSGPLIETQEADEIVQALASGSACVAGGTAWLWASERLTDTVDVLVVDEAGQMSLASVLAAAQAARSVILLGDPQQLEQPLQAAHPEGTAVSVLQHVLGEHQTLPPNRGLFLAETYRMHPDVCRFTSELFYESRLHPVAGLERQVLRGSDDLSGAGLWFVSVEHDGNQNSSPEEAEAVKALVGRLLDGGMWTDRHGVERRLGLDDILIVAPYNAQVSEIRDRIPGARVGTVDRFQGQEAAVVIYSLTTSCPEDAQRGMEFLYSLNRLNVATSRARCAVIVVASPRLFEPDCQTPRQMKLANALCRLREMAKTT